MGFRTSSPPRFRWCGATCQEDQDLERLLGYTEFEANPQNRNEALVVRAQLTKHLPCKRKDLLLIPRTQGKKGKQGLVDPFVIAALGRQVDPWACRPVSLIYMESSCLKSQDDNVLKPLRLFTALHVHVNSPIHMHLCTHFSFQDPG